MHRPCFDMRLFLRLALCAMAILAVACSDNELQVASRHGELQLLLSGTSTNGVVYRLRNATFSITGASTVTATTDDNVETEGMDIELITGHYAVTLDSGWFLQARSPGGDFVTVDATLTSTNPQSFTIEAQTTSKVVFRFLVAGDVIVTGKGTVAISIEVGNCAPGTAVCQGTGAVAGAAGQATGAGGTGETAGAAGQATGAGGTGGTVGFVCSAGHADCDGISTNGCEVDLRSDNVNCGKCGVVCLPNSSVDTCINGVCDCARPCWGLSWQCCPAGSSCSHGMCYQLSSDASNCGSVGAKCRSGQMCVDAHCVPCGSTPPSSTNLCITCRAGYAECDDSDSTYCEATIEIDTANCGACGHVCPVVPNSAAFCSNGGCGWRCSTGYADCDNNPSNGCERVTSSSCSSCDNHERAVGVAVGRAFACAVLQSGKIVCWGGDSSNWSNIGTASIGTTPQEVTGLPPAKSISINPTSTNAMCALLTDGSVQCWNATSATPAPVAGIANAIALSGSGTFACALISNGTVQCWGGSGGPAAVSGITQVAQISVGGNSGCGVRIDGVLQCWDSSLQAVGVMNRTDVVEVSAGGESTCARLASGEVECWGNNSLGVLGDGTQSASSVPVKVVGVSHAISIATGRGEACAVLSGGAIHCWGSCPAGSCEIGLEGAATAVTLGAGWTIGTDVACALFEDGSVGCWGDNEWGQLGNGTIGLSGVSKVTGLCGNNG